MPNCQILRAVTCAIGHLITLFANIYRRYKCLVRNGEIFSKLYLSTTLYIRYFFSYWDPVRVCNANLRVNLKVIWAYVAFFGIGKKTETNQMFYVKIVM